MNVHLSGQDVLDGVSVDSSWSYGGSPLMVNLVDMLVDFLVVEKSTNCFE